MLTSNTMFLFDFGTRVRVNLRYWRALWGGTFFPEAPVMSKKCWQIYLSDVILWSSMCRYCDAEASRFATSQDGWRTEWARGVSSCPWETVQRLWFVNLVLLIVYLNFSVEKWLWHSMFVQFPQCFRHLCSIDFVAVIFGRKRKQRKQIFWLI